MRKSLLNMEKFDRHFERIIVEFQEKFKTFSRNFKKYEKIMEKFEKLVGKFHENICIVSLRRNFTGGKKNLGNLKFSYPKSPCSAIILQKF